MAAFVARFSSRIGVAVRCLYCRSVSSQSESGSPSPPKGFAEMDEIKKNPYFVKYADKIAALQKSAPEELKERLEKVSKPRASVEDSDKSSRELLATGKSAVNQPLPHAQNRVDGPSHVRQRELNDVVKLDLLRNKSSEEISKIWQEYHQTRDKIAAVIPAQIYSTMFERSQRYPTFVYPLPRQQGVEFFLAQFNLHDCHFTPLVDFQAHKDMAAECLAIVHFPELHAEKGIVLMQGEYNTDILNGTEAQCLANQVQLYYNSKPDSDRYRLLDTFNLNPNDFQHEDLIRQLHSLQF